MRRRHLLGWVLVAVWLVVIRQFGESQVLAVSAADPVHRWVLRKAIHLVVYGVLGGALAVAIGGPRRWRWVLGLCLLAALGDEVHQHFVPRRSFNLHDVGIDLAGGVVGTTVGQVLARVAVAGDPTGEPAR